MSLKPPETKYRLTVEVRGNTHQEVIDEIAYLLNGGYLMDSDYYKRDEFDVMGGRATRCLEHTNPEMTAERYNKELTEWADNRRDKRDDPPSS